MKVQIDFHKPMSVYFIGIGGVSMSGLAELLFTRGFSVSGSDAKESSYTRHLEELGIHVVYGQRAEHIVPGIDLVVYTAAIHPDNPEFAAAKATGLPLMDRATLLGQIMSHYPNAIAVSGTHGKTTTTAMLSCIYLNAALDPTITLGGTLPEIDSNLRIGASGHFIMEACEYTNSFHHFRPTTALVLNVEADHLDFFSGIKQIRESFTTFLGLLPKDGLLVINGEIPDYQALYAGLPVRAVTYGLAGGPFDYMAEDIRFDEAGHGSYTLSIRGKSAGRIELGVVGRHNISNSLAAIAAALEYRPVPEAAADTDLVAADAAASPHLTSAGLPPANPITLSEIASALKSFHGTDRRFQNKGIRKGVTVIDDYAHHPTEVTATLASARQGNYHQIWCVFQPHTYSRTRLLLNDFAEALSHADKVVLTDIYAAREADPGDISSADLLAKLTERGVEAYYFKNFEEIENFLIHNCTNGDLLITMGAGDVVNIGENFLQL